MDTYWFLRKPGDIASPSIDDETMAIVGDDVPDWVRLPTDLGGGRLRVLAIQRSACPKCSAPDVRHLELDDSYGVAECHGCGFVWYRWGNG